MKEKRVYEMLPIGDKPLEFVCDCTAARAQELQQMVGQVFVLRHISWRDYCLKVTFEPGNGLCEVKDGDSDQV